MWWLKQIIGCDSWKQFQGGQCISSYYRNEMDTQITNKTYEKHVRFTKIVLAESRRDSDWDVQKKIRIRA